MPKEIKRYVLRVHPVLYGRIVSASKQADLSINDWLTATVREKLDGGVPMPSAQPTPAAKPTAQSLAARFGVTTAAQLASNGAEQRSAEPIVVGNCPVEHLHDWVKLYRDMQEMEPTEAEYSFRKAVDGIKLPVGFVKMPAPKQLAWLQTNA